MKKIILSIMVVAFYLSPINAQFHFGIKGGATFDNFSYKDDKKELSIDRATGWQAGVLMQLKVPVIGIAVQPELLYTVHKAQVTDSGGKDKSNSISYVEVPINLQWGPDIPLLRPYIEAGPYFGYAVNIKGDELKDRIDKIDWGIGLGIGLEVWKLQLGARYTWGLQDVSSVKDFEMKNKALRLSLGILF